jgi:hypothetical protein
VVYRDVTRQAKGLYRLKHVGALRNGLTYLSRYISGWFCHMNEVRSAVFWEYDGASIIKLSINKLLTAKISKDRG